MATKRQLFASFVLLLGACEAPETSNKVPTSETLAPSASNGNIDAVGVRPKKQENPPTAFCYRLESPGGGTLRLSSLKLNLRYKARLWVAVQADTLSKQLTSFRIDGVQKRNEQTGKALRYIKFVEHQIPDSLQALLPKLRKHILTTPVQVITADYRCEMPTDWLLPVNIE